MMTMWTPTLTPEHSTKYEQIVNAIEQDIATGALKPGDRLPPQRKLAKHLAMTTGTIGRAYALAEKRGLVKSEVGRGAFVAAPNEISSPNGDRSRLTIDLGLNLPPDIHETRAYETTFLELSRRRNLDELFGAVPVEAFEHQREAAAQWLYPRIACTREEVVICTGTQNALVSTLATLTQPGDSILVESSTFPGILNAAKLLQLNLIPVPMDAGGLIPDEVKRLAGQAKAIYVNPTNQNPTTSTLSLARRRELVKIAEKSGLWVLEDDAYGHFFEAGPPTLTSLLPNQSILIASLSKTMAVGLRLAFVYAPTRARKEIVSRFQAISFFPSPLSIEVASRWIANGTADSFVKKRREIALRRQEIARQILRPEWIVGAPQLNHLWMRLPESWTATSLSHAAAENGVIVFPSNAFAATDSCRENAIRIALGAARTDEELKVALSKMVRMLDGGTRTPEARF